MYTKHRYDENRTWLAAEQRGLKYTEHKPIGRHYLGVTTSESTFQYYGSHCVQQMLQLPFHQSANVLSTEYQIYNHLSFLSSDLLTPPPL
jgi:hypothetical protein